MPFYKRLAEVRRLVSSIRRGVPFDPIVVTPEELTRRLAEGDVEDAALGAPPSANEIRSGLQTAHHLADWIRKKVG